MRRIENECVGCEHCINCGRRHIEVICCDTCDMWADDEYHIYDINGKELCFECAKEALTQMQCDDCDSERCADCRNEAETLYQLDGDWLCSECIYKILERDYKINE